MNQEQLRTYEQLLEARQQSKNPINITQQEWIILSDGWMKEDHREQQTNN